MIVVKIQGGLGNQISQYAMSRWLQNKYPEHQVKLDASWCETHAPGFELVQAFNKNRLQYLLATPKDVFCATGIFYGDTANQVWAKVHNKLVRGGRKLLGNSTEIQQQVASGYPVTQQVYHLDKGHDWYINGFWHNWDYTSMLPQLQNELVYTPWTEKKFAVLQSEICGCNGVAVHIRLGDYSGSEHDILPASNYYKDALQQVLDKLPKPVIYLFSDEPEKAFGFLQDIAKDALIQVVNSQGRPPYTDMILMSSCKAVVCANSTYSYWAALLGHRPGHIITIPEYYTKNRKMWKNNLCSTIPLDMKA